MFLCNAFKYEGFTMLSSDPLPPTQLRVTGRTTNTVSISWQHDSSKSYCEKWKVNYAEKDKTQIKTIAINSVVEKSVTIRSLAPGMTYTIKVFAITSGDVVSKTAVELEATTSKYQAHLYYYINPQKN